MAKQNSQSATALQTISNAAEVALQTIASAALDANKLLAANANEAAKIVHQQNIDHGSDHDLLTILNTKVEAIGADVKNLVTGTGKRLSDLENEKLNIRDSYPVLYKCMRT